MDNQERLIAVDGGATKTDMILFDRTGTVINRVIGGPSNSSEIGFERSIETLTILFEQLLKNHQKEEPIQSIHMALAGGGIGSNRARYERFLQDLFPDVPHIRTDSDAISALNAGLRKEDGMVLIAGTGSAVFVRHAGQIHQVGGWGHLLSDEGSGYDIGRMGLRRVLQAYDGRMPPTLLTELMRQAIGQPVQEAIQEIYDGGKRLIASLAPQVFLAMEKGDDAARSIIHEGANQLVLLVKAGSQFLHKQPYLVVLSGGLWNASNNLLEKLVFNELGPQYQAIKPSLPPVFGSAIDAMTEAGYFVNDDFEKKFKQSLDLISVD
ncbi:MAG: hypothetical protein KBG64_04575 [Clostridia bacterium]|nr:hypothetical protein [Clostridia bacterium]